MFSDVLKYNPYHGKDGRFASSGNGNPIERHGKDFNAKNEREYIRSIKALLNKPIAGNIIGYDTSTGRTVRADTNKQLFASTNLKKRRNLHWIF